MSRIRLLEQEAQDRADLLRQELARLEDELARVVKDLEELARFQAWLDTHPVIQDS